MSKQAREHHPYIESNRLSMVYMWHSIYLEHTSEHQQLLPSLPTPCPIREVSVSGSAPGDLGEYVECLVHRPDKPQIDTPTLFLHPPLITTSTWKVNININIHTRIKPMPTNQIIPETTMPLPLPFPKEGAPFLSQSPASFRRPLLPLLTGFPSVESVPSRDACSSSPSPFVAHVEYNTPLTSKLNRIIAGAL